MKQRILILCTGNSCRSQMAEGFLKSLDKNLEVYSAGTKPAEKVNPFAVKAMKEIGIDISRGIPENVEKYEREIKKMHADDMETSPKAIIAALEGMKYRTSKLDVLTNARFPILFILGKKDSRIPFEKTLAQALRQRLASPRVTDGD